MQILTNQFAQYIFTFVKTRKLEAKTKILIG